MCGCSFFFSRVFFVARCRPLLFPVSQMEVPNQQRTLNELPTELRYRNFVTKHTNRRQTCKKFVCNVHVLQLNFHFACHRWWLGSSCTTKRKTARVSYHGLPKEALGDAAERNILAEQRANQERWFLSFCPRRLRTSASLPAFLPDQTVTSGMSLWWVCKWHYPRLNPYNRERFTVQDSLLHHESLTSVRTLHYCQIQLSTHPNLIVVYSRLMFFV